VCYFVPLTEVLSQIGAPIMSEVPQGVLPGGLPGRTTWMPPGGGSFNLNQMGGLLDIHSRQQSFSDQFGMVPLTPGTDGSGVPTGTYSAPLLHSNSFGATAPLLRQLSVSQAGMCLYLACAKARSGL
jgi:hypothetical protein